MMQEQNRERDEYFMRMALELAEKGRGWTSPNPVVGAVIVRDDGAVIGQGYHERYGELHAERNALKNCTESPKGATLYCTLEPCCHHGKQPPCTEAILEAGIRRVVVGSGDPNPLVGGKGIRILREHGVEVTEGILQEECDRSNEIFFHYIRTGTPYVVMKYAMTLDGKIAAYTGESKWITGEEARQHVQQLRHNLQGIMVGIGTILADDPLLTCRLPDSRNPVRIVCDSNLRTPLSSRLVRTAREVPTIIATCSEDREKISRLEDSGCRVLQVGAYSGQDPVSSENSPVSSETEAVSPETEEMLLDTGGFLFDADGLAGGMAGIYFGTPDPLPEYSSDGTGLRSEVSFSGIDLRALMQKLGEEKIDSILLEGGGTLNWSALESGIVHRVMAYISPKLFGGSGAKTPVEGQGVTAPKFAHLLKDTTVTRLGEDFLIEGTIRDH